MAVVIIHRHMKHPAVIPNGQHSRHPLQADHKLRLGDVVHQILKNGHALFPGPPFDSMGMGQAAVDAPSACIVVGANQRMLNLALSINSVVIAAAE